MNVAKPSAPPTEIDFNSGKPHFTHTQAPPAQPVESPEIEQLRERVRQAVEKLHANFSKTCTCFDCRVVEEAISLLKPVMGER